MENSTLKQTTIESLIYEIRGQKIMLDRDLASLYGVSTGNLNKAVKRNIERFPERYMFQLTSDENLKFQNGISSWGGSRSLPYAFTEQGVAMLSSVLHSPAAIQISIRIIDAFVAMRNYIMSTKTISDELEAIKAKLELLERNDEDNLEAINDLSEDMRREIDTIYQAIAALSVKEPMQKEPQRQKIGFKTQNSK
ncbi:MAG: ORF6N domain-containing protein [Bacteroidales bacterium]|nr:ORF6N domain-containing protein [Bacteroidales bacterium]